MNMMITAFLIALALLTASGAMAWARKRKTPEDYPKRGQIYETGTDLYSRIFVQQTENKTVPISRPH